MPVVKPFLAFLDMNPKLQRLILWILSFILKDERLFRILSQFKELSLPDTELLQQNAIDFQSQFEDHWKKLKIDVLLCPSMVLPATPYGSFADITINAGYSFIWNFLNVPAGIVPVTKVDPKVDKPYAVDRNNKGFIFRRRDCLEANMARYYDPKIQEGFPVSVQIVGPQYGDEMVLRAMKDLENLLKKNLD